MIRADSEERTELEASGWRIIARSWGAGLKAGAIDRAHLTALTDRHSADVVIRELTENDATAILRLDASTLGDYPGDIATEFTVVHRRSRGQGLSTAVKAASVLALAAEGYDYFRTGGSGDNAAIIAANSTVGYMLDEEWLTFIAPDGAPPRMLR